MMKQRKRRQKKTNSERNWVQRMHGERHREWISQANMFLIFVSYLLHHNHSLLFHGTAIAIYKYKHQIQGHIVSKSVFFTVHFFHSLSSYWVCIFCCVFQCSHFIHINVLLNRTQKPLFSNSSFFSPFKKFFF